MIKLNNNFCVPNCLEFILRKRGLDIDKNEIVKELELGNDGIKVDNEIINNFLKKFNLKCAYKSPYVNLESDLILKELDNKDILAAYDSSKLSDESGPFRHISIILHYDSNSDMVYLFDPPEKRFKIDLVKLNNAMRFDEDNRYGFYLVSEIK